VDNVLADINRVDRLVNQQLETPVGHPLLAEGPMGGTSLFWIADVDAWFGRRHMWRLPAPLLIFDGSGEFSKAWLTTLLDCRSLRQSNYSQKLLSGRG
jgi:hypothetical protein